MNTAISTAPSGTIISMGPGSWTNCAVPISFPASKLIYITGAGAIIDCAGIGTAFATASSTLGGSISGVKILTPDTGISLSHACKMVITNVTVSNAVTQAVYKSGVNVHLTVTNTTFTGMIYIMCYYNRW